MQRYAITDGDFGPDEEVGQQMVRRCAELARSGVEFMLIREKVLAAGELVGLSRRVIAAVRERPGGTRVLVSGRVDVAVAAGADGVHLGSGAGELRVTQVRQVFPGAFVSVSCHTLEEVKRAGEEGADAVLVAPVFGKWVDGVEVVAGLGLEVLSKACHAAGKMPVFALGGVTEANAEDCVRVGATGVAGIRMFFAPQGRVNVTRAGV